MPILGKDNFLGAGSKMRSLKIWKWLIFNRGSQLQTLKLWKWQILGKGRDKFWSKEAKWWQRKGQISDKGSKMVARISDFSVVN